MNALTIDFAPLLPLAALAVAGAAIIAITVFSAVTRAPGAIWRIAAAIFLGVILTRPTLVSELREPLKDVVIVATDRTPSTELAGRSADIDTALADLRSRLGQYAKTLDVKEVEVRHTSIAASGEGSLIYGRLAEALADIPRNRLAGAILLTDGQAHDMPKEVQTVSTRAPVHVLLAGSRNTRDRRLVVVNAPAYGIVGKSITVTLRVEDPRRNSEALARMTIRRHGEPFLEKTLPIGRDAPISFELEHGGPTVLEFSVEPGEDELTVRLWFALEEWNQRTPIGTRQCRQSDRLQQCRRHVDPGNQMRRVGTTWRGNARPADDQRSLGGV